jgi:hypothetical protein
MAAFQSHVNPGQAKILELPQILFAFTQDVLGIAIKGDAIDPGEALSDAAEYLDEFFLGQAQDIAIRQKNSLPAPAIAGRKIKILRKNLPVLQAKNLIPVRGAESAFVVGTANRNLENYAVGLAWRPDDVALVIHPCFDGRA